TSANATTVSFGAAAATSVNCASSTVCTASSPAGAGPVDVTVTTAGGTSAVSAADQFSYPPPPTPILSGTNPTSGPGAGGTSVTINGSNFSTVPGATTISFGSSAGTGVSCLSSTSCTVTSPPGSGVVDIRVTVGGQSS